MYDEVEYVVGQLLAITHPKHGVPTFVREQGCGTRRSREAEGHEGLEICFGMPARTLCGLGPRSEGGEPLPLHLAESFVRELAHFRVVDRPEVGWVFAREANVGAPESAVASDRIVAGFPRPGLHGLEASPETLSRERTKQSPSVCEVPSWGRVRHAEVARKAA